MKKNPLLTALGLSLALILPLPAIAQKADAPPPVKVTDAWTKPSVPGASVSASYMKLQSSVPLKLINAESSAAGQVEIHNMFMTDGVMHMNPAGPLELVPGKTLEMKPGGLHVMLMKLKAPIKAGDPVAVRLTFVGQDNKPFTTTVDARAQEMGKDKGSAKH
jgi:hypothetical protein